MQQQTTNIMGSYGDVVPLASNVDNVAENGEEITVMVTGFAVSLHELCIHLCLDVMEAIAIY